MIRPWLRVVVAAIVCGVSSPAVAGPPPDGSQLFTAQKCTLCHSVAGKGNPKGALDDVGKRLDADEIRQWLVSPKEMSATHQATRKPPMKSFADLSKADLDALVGYLMTLKSAK